MFAQLWTIEKFFWTKNKRKKNERKRMTATLGKWRMSRRAKEKSFFTSHFVLELFVEKKNLLEEDEFQYIYFSLKIVLCFVSLIKNHCQTARYQLIFCHWFFPTSHQWITSVWPDRIHLFFKAIHPNRQDKQRLSVRFSPSSSLSSV